MRILLVQTSFLGDVILSSPVIAGIRKLYPEAEIYTLTTPVSAGLLRSDPILKGCLTFDKKGADSSIGGMLRKVAEIKSCKFDKAFVLQRSYRTAILMRLSCIPDITVFKEASLSFLFKKRVSRAGYEHEVQRNMAILAAETAGDQFEQDLRLFAPEQVKETGSASALEPGYALLAPGSAWATKRWDWRGYRKLAELLKARGMRVVVTGSREEAAYNVNVTRDLGLTDLSGKLGIEDLLFVASRAGLIVCNDSMTLHLASAFKIPVVAVFCATSPKFGFGPWKNPRAVCVEKEGLACKPCRRHGSKTCPEGTNACMEGLSAEQVMQAVEKVLSVTVQV